MKTKTDNDRQRPTKTALRASVFVGLCLSLSAFSPATFKHVHLLRSDPGSDSTVQAVPERIAFWFSGPVQVPVFTVHLTDSTNRVVETARARLVTGADTSVVADVRGAMAPGKYGVRWRTMSRDGHVVSGRFFFTLAAPEAHEH